MKYEVITRPKAGYVFPKVISFDTEYSEKNIRKARLLSISIGVSPELTYILEDFTAVKRFIKDAEIVLTWNGVVDFFMIEKHFNEEFERGKMIDGMLLEHLIDERLDHGLGDFALREYNDNYKEEFWSKYKTYQEAPKEETYEYEMRDGVYTFRAGTKYLAALRGKMGLVEHVHRLQWALFDTEIRGLRVNRDLMVKTRDTMKAQIDEYLPKLRSEFDEYCKIWELEKWKEEIEKRSTISGKHGVKPPVFSFTSDRQLSWLVYQALELPCIEKTKKGNPSTASEVLRTLSEEHSGLKSIVEYKETKAVYSTFVEGMLERVEDDSRIYPGFFINGTATGRISHNNPNMGNLPTDGVIRNFFIPDNGNVIIGADYSQLEVVLELNLTEDESLKKIVLEGKSKHDVTAEGLGIGRNDAKTLNFALQYGAGVFKVGKILHVSNEQAQDIFDRYWVLYSGVKRLKDETCKRLAEDGFVTNIFGRVRHFDRPRNEFEKAKQERQAYNFLIQGPGGDMMNMAAYHIQETLQARKLGRLWFSVHDEAVAECNKNSTDEAIAAIVNCMDIPNSYLNLKYPVPCKTYGPLERWGKG